MTTSPNLDAFVTIKIDDDHVLSISEVFGRNQTEIAIVQRGEVLESTIRRVSNLDILQDYLWEWFGDRHGL